MYIYQQKWQVPFCKRTRTMHRRDLSARSDLPRMGAGPMIDKVIAGS